MVKFTLLNDEDVSIRSLNLLIALIKKKIPDMQFIKTDESLSQSFEKLADRIAKALILSEKAQSGKNE